MIEKINAEIVYCTNCHFTGLIAFNGAVCPGCRCIEVMKYFDTVIVPDCLVYKSEPVEMIQ